MTDLHAESAKDNPIAELCGLFGVSKQAYYQYDEDVALAKAAREEFALQYIKEIRKLDPGMGGPKMWVMYQSEFGCDRPIGRDRFCIWMFTDPLCQEPTKPRLFPFSEADL